MEKQRRFLFLWKKLTLGQTIKNIFHLLRCPHGFFWGAHTTNQNQNSESHHLFSLSTWVRWKKIFFFNQSEYEPMRSERLSFFVWGRARPSPPLPPTRYGTGRIQRGEGGFFPSSNYQIPQKKKNRTTRISKPGYMYMTTVLWNFPPPSCLNITRSAPRCQGTPRVRPWLSHSLLRTVSPQDA